ncbi:hypothetical protein ABFA07_017498 [Porites harrisoni]
MEILPILEAKTSPKPNVWYVLSPEGDGPCIRVGHTCTFVAGESRRVLVIGGANPDGSFADVFVLDLEKYEWSCPEWKGIASRYEHSAFIPKCNPQRVYVFGGAQQATNLNDVQFLDLEKGQWETVETTGNPPSPRTCHSMASVGSKFYVFGGGLSGPDPVLDTTLHVFNAEDNSWSQPEVKGSPPCSRHGHVSVAIGTDIYVHGGMAGTDMFDDLYRFNTVNHTWSKLQPTGQAPCSRTAHAAACIGRKIIIHGGMNSVGAALDDVYTLDTETLTWTKAQIKGPSPAPRLDHTLCAVEIPISTGDGVSSQAKIDGSLPVLLVFGGMDTQGEIFNDCLVLMSESTNKKSIK